MSTIKADTIVASDGSSPVTLTGQSAAKAWVNFNGTGTIAERDSFNVSSLTDVGTGDYKVTFSNAFADSNYISVPASGRDVTTDTGNVVTISYTTTTTDISTFRYGANTRQDVSIVGLANHGDLA